jgi:hypothetical protein
MRILVTLAIALGLLLVAGSPAPGADGSCSPASTPQSFKASCDQPSGLKQCWEFTGAKYSDAALSKLSCPGGTHSTTARCTAKVGRCLKNCGKDIEMVMFFSDGDEANWKKSCEANGKGTWLGR